jgi:hypothetical protein
VKVVLINGTELRAESDEDVEKLLRWAASTYEPFHVPQTRPGLQRPTAPTASTKAEEDIVDGLEEAAVALAPLMLAGAEEGEAKE